MRRNAKLNLVAAVFCATALFACGGGGGGSSGGGTTPVDGNLTLNVDQMSSVPLVNGNPQAFYMYVTNYGTAQLSDLSWSATLQSTSSASNSGILAKLKTQVSSLVPSLSSILNSTTNPITITDQSQCTQIAPNGTCRVALQATAPGVVLLSATSGSKKVTLQGGGGLVQSYEETTPTNSVPLDSILTTSPISGISYAGNGGSYTFSIINNGESSVTINPVDITGLPSNATLDISNCPTPLPGRTACQVRIVLNNPSGSTTDSSSFTVHLGGTVNNADSSTTKLPDQLYNPTINGTTANVGIIQFVAQQSLVVDASYGTAAPASAVGIISNSGTGPLVINSVAGNSPLITISNDTCSGKTLGQNETCTYTANLTVASINSSSSDTVNISYGTSGANAYSTIIWTYIPILPVAAPSINLTATPSLLDQTATTATVMVSNNGNVTLSNLTAPTLTPNNPRVAITATTCNGTLAVGASCNYTVTYTPAAPSETSSVTLGGISATAPDNRGSTLNSSFNNTVSFNLSSIFAGALNLTGNLTLSDTTTSGLITVTNDGNHTATIKAIAMQSGSSTKLSVSGGSCTTTTSLTAGQSCTVGILFNDTSASGSGNGALVVTYDNNNGDASATSSNSNISWLIGSAPSLKVDFASSSLTTTLTVESTTTVILTNNGRDALGNVTLPTLAAPLSWKAGPSNSCALGGTQQLTIGDSCTVKLAYTPTTAHATYSQSLGAFTASYKTGSMQYTSSPYSITLTGLTRSAISAAPSSVTQSATWVVPTASTLVTLTNNGQSAADITGITSDSSAVTTTGCTGALASGRSCTLTVNGNYAATTNAVLTVNYTDAAGSSSMTINVTGNYTAMPVVTPSVTFTSSLFNSTVSRLISTTSPEYQVTVTNNSTATNGGDASVTIPYASLLPTDDSYASYSMDTSGISSNPCTLPSVGGTMTLSQGQSCSYNWYITTSGTATGSTGISKSLTSTYNYNLYNGSSLTPSTTTANVVSSFTLKTALPVALLDVVVNPSNTANNFSGIEQGLSPAPTVVLKISNTGTGAVSGNLTLPTFPAGITVTGNTCGINLAASANCMVTLTESTANVIAAGNLNTLQISYNNGVNSVNTQLPGVPYSVNSVSTPGLSLTTAVTGCYSGNGIVSTCYANPDNYGGSASGIKIELTVNNYSTDTNLSSVALTPASKAVFTGTSPAYTLSSENCSVGVAKNSSCKIVYAINSSASTTNIAPNIAATTLGLMESWTTPQGQLKSVTTFLPESAINISVVLPVLSVGAIADIETPNSGSTTVTWSSLYQSAAPTTTVTATDSTGTAVTGLSVSLGGWAKSGATATATATVSSTHDTTTTTGAKLNAGATIGVQSLSATSTFNVTTAPRIIFPTTGTSYSLNNGLATLDADCASDAGKPNDGQTYKALVGSSTRQALPTNIGWVLSPRQEYVSSVTGLTLGTTNDSAVFNFPLQNPLSSAGGYGYATGLNADWTVGENCSDWTTNASTSVAYQGFSILTTYMFISRDDGGVYCNSTRPLYCVQQ